MRYESCDGQMGGGHGVAAAYGDACVGAEGVDVAAEMVVGVVVSLGGAGRGVCFASGGEEAEGEGGGIVA